MIRWIVLGLGVLVALIAAWQLWRRIVETNAEMTTGGRHGPEVTQRGMEFSPNHVVWYGPDAKGGWTWTERYPE